MKKKSKKARLKRKNEFRFHKVEVTTKKGRIRKISHPAYVFLEKGNIYIYVSTTHSKGVEGYMLIKMKKNPNPHDTRDTYIVLDVREDIKSAFGSKEEDWEIDKDDESVVRSLYVSKKKR